MKNGLRVKIKQGAGLPSEFTEGVIVGVIAISMPFIGKVYAVDVGKEVEKQYPYQVVGIPEIHMI
jgi:hypothetical protein